MSKRYRLKKDLPDVKAGAVFIHDGKYSYDYESKNKLPSWYDESNVENNPEWFEEIHQPKEDKPEQITIDDACNVYNTFVLEKRQSFRSALKEFYSQKSKPKEELKEPERKGCGICGGALVMIRGKYPGMDKREVCPTCNTERLEQINEISSKSYGQAYQVSENQSSLK